MLMKLDAIERMEDKDQEDDWCDECLLNKLGCEPVRDATVAGWLYLA